MGRHSSRRFSRFFSKLNFERNYVPKMDPAFLPTYKIYLQGIFQLSAFIKIFKTVYQRVTMIFLPISQISCSIYSPCRYLNSVIFSLVQFFTLHPGSQSLEANIMCLKIYGLKSTIRLTYLEEGLS